MSLTQEDKTEMRQMFQDCIAPIKVQLSSIEAQTLKTNGRVTHLETEVHDALIEKEQIKAYRDKKYQEFDDRLTGLRDVPAKVRVLEDDNLSNKSVKKFMAAMFGGGMALGGLIVGVIKLIMG